MKFELYFKLHTSELETQSMGFRNLYDLNLGLGYKLDDSAADLLDPNCWKFNCIVLFRPKIVTFDFDVCVSYKNYFCLYVS